MDNPTVSTLAGLRGAFLALRTPGDLAELLAVSPNHLAAVAARPSYHIFEILKKTGDKRLIEDPDDRLQPIQANLNDYLQSVYWKQRSPAAYGFLVVPTGDPEPRHIETNAARHLGKPWLLNCDLEDFFHQITQEKVDHLFREPPFEFDQELTDILVRLTTFRGRCPMGAPTSPVLSNLVFAKTDHDLLTLAYQRGWNYTRYADDMSFSSLDTLTWDDYTDVQRVAKKHQFVFNPAKAMLFGPAETKMVTGLVLGLHDVEIPANFIPQVTEDIKQLAGAVKVQFRVNPRNPRTIDRFRRSVEGKIRFAGRIMGEKHPGVRKLWQDYRAAMKTPDDNQARSWLDFDYF